MTPNPPLQTLPPQVEEAKERIIALISDALGRDATNYLSAGHRAVDALILATQEAARAEQQETIDHERHEKETVAETAKAYSSWAHNRIVDLETQLSTLTRENARLQQHEKHVFDNGSGMTETMTVPEMIAEIQRLGKRCEELYTWLQEDIRPLNARIKELEQAINNCDMLARREIRKADQSHASSRWNHIRRFCKEVGVSSETGVLRESVEEGAPPQEQGWQPISSAPKDGTQILLWITGIEPRPRIGFWSERESESGWYGLQSQHFTGFNVPFWMPLPQPPAPEAQ